MDSFGRARLRAGGIYAISTAVAKRGRGVEIPVSCVEQGRWGRRQAWRRAEAFAPARSIRAAQRAGVVRSLRRDGSRAGDQGGVWQEVDAMLGEEGVASDTAAASDLKQTYRRKSSRADGRRGTRRTRSATGPVRNRRCSRRPGDGYGSVRRAALALGPLGRLVRESVLSAVPTHWDWRCGWSCALANLACAAALRGETLSAEALLRSAQDGMAASLPALRDYGYRAEIPSSVSEAVILALRSTMDDLRFDGDDMGFTLLSLQAALISYWRAEDFESGLRKAVEAGGDTDTNGAIVGAVLGARFGLAAIPERWRRRVDGIRTGRVSMEACSDRLAAMRA